MLPCLEVVAHVVNNFNGFMSCRSHRVLSHFDNLRAVRGESVAATPDWPRYELTRMTRGMECVPHE